MGWPAKPANLRAEMIRVKTSRVGEMCDSFSRGSSPSAAALRAALDAIGAHMRASRAICARLASGNPV